jgi:hypothetical protein
MYWKKHGGVMVSVLASSAVDSGFESRSSQTKDYKIGICWFSAKHAALRRKSKDWLARNQNNVSEWSDMSTRGLLFQWSSTIKIQLSVLVKYKADLIIISLKINLYSPWYSWKIVELAFKQQSLTHSLTLKKTPKLKGKTIKKCNLYVFTPTWMCELVICQLYHDVSTRFDVIMTWTHVLMWSWHEHTFWCDHDVCFVLNLQAFELNSAYYETAHR